ncbi:MAG: hypothetical protein F6K40_17895 [Okeania sp. SIO3I5]|uniref:hypothetical protein n=1 Tax=Okeania sp. SIO3I5 TaxID=2607805 RepID=UPI0013BB66CB|nr:hypothetical protein [Okeania sp. SIO3I5]NEQ38030.1 hypothetical protein [Okeania sp. SIO3I5]
MKETARLDIIPESLGEVPELELALNIANQANFSREELDEFDRRAMMLQDERGKINYTREKGRAESKTEVIILLVDKRFGEVDQDISNQISVLVNQAMKSKELQ